MSSSEPAKGNGDFRKRPRRTFTPEQKQATIEAFEQAKKADPSVRLDQWAAAQGIHSSMLARWRKERGKKTRNAVRPARNKNTPDHERDIAALAVLNSSPQVTRIEQQPMPISTGDRQLDERLGTVLGATIAEVLRRLQR